MSSNPMRVLIIDDHASFRSVARELLERRGFAVVGEADGAAAGLEAAERVCPEAVLLDVRLRDGNGFEVCQRLTRDDPELAVLLVSADEPDRRLAHVESCGARGFVLKSRLAAVDLPTLLGATRSPASVDAARASPVDARRPGRRPTRLKDDASWPRQGCGSVGRRPPGA